MSSICVIEIDVVAVELKVLHFVLASVLVAIGQKARRAGCDWQQHFVIGH